MSNLFLIMDEEISFFSSDRAMQINIRQKLRSRDEGELITEEDIEAEFERFGNI